VTHDPRVLEMSDAGHTPAAISLATGLAPGKVYATLRAQRPDRPRAPRARTSPVPGRVVALADVGVRAGRIAELLGCSGAYVYRILSEATPPASPAPLENET
jgi:hypothetical protein